MRKRLGSFLLIALFIVALGSVGACIAYFCGGAENWAITAVVKLLATP